jgi:hypothetical protein
MGDPDARWDRLHAAGPWVLDGLLALAAAGAGVALLATVLPFDPGSPRAWTAYLLVLAYTMPIAVRRLFPLPALAWALATGAAFAALGLNLVTLSFAILVYVYTVAVTNVVRHAGPATARVVVRYAPGRVDVEVVDDGRGGDPGDQDRGHGIAGMRERAALYGGTLETGPLPGGGFRVAASLPLEEVS